MTKPEDCQTAAMTMVCKSRGGPRIRAQLLYYPPTDARCEYPSHEAFADDGSLRDARLEKNLGEVVGALLTAFKPA